MPDDITAESGSALTGDKVLVDPASIEAKRTSKWNAVLWFSYDAADTYFSQLILSLAFTPFALLLGINAGWGYETTFVLVSVFMAVSNLLIAIFGPIIGSFSDIAGKRKAGVILVASIMIATTALITTWANFWWACGLFVIANFCYQAGRMLYDAQIPFIAKTEERSFTQALGGSIAFIGSVLAVVTSMLVGKYLGKWDTVSSAIWNVDSSQFAAGSANFGGLQWLFLIGAIIIAVMSIPYLFHQEVENPREISMKENMKQSLQTFRITGKEIIKDRNSILFFLGWFFITDAANTAILYMAVTLQGAVGFDKAFTDIVILVGIAGSLIFAVITGLFMNKFGPKIAFIVNGISWAIAITTIMLSGWILRTTVVVDILPTGTKQVTTILLMTPQWIAFLGAFFVGIGFGGIWIVGRQFIMELAPPSKVAQYGGFQKIAGRVSAIVSPLIYSGLIFAFKSKGLNMAYRFALGSLLLFFIVGVLIISFIKDPHKRYLAGERAPYTGLYKKAQE